MSTPQDELTPDLRRLVLLEADRILSEHGEASRGLVEYLRAYAAPPATAFPGDAFYRLASFYQSHPFAPGAGDVILTVDGKPYTL